MDNYPVLAEQQKLVAQSVEAAEYTDYISAEG